MSEKYIQHPGKVISANKYFPHVMALTLNPLTDFHTGVVRCITSREGDVRVKGYTDRSQLNLISGDSLDSFVIGEKLEIRGETEILQDMTPPDYEFIGLEDPDIWIDPQSRLVHLYFTIPIKPNDNNLEKSKKTKISLGHAVGKDLASLEMMPPVLVDTYYLSAKEVSIAPINKLGFRYNLIESRDRTTATTYSIIMTAKADNMSKPWQYGDIVFHPKNSSCSWIAGHASPGPLLPSGFLDVGQGKVVGFINGREANQTINGQIVHGVFSVGLFVYDYEQGKIDWVSPQPFIKDSEAQNITFASQFVQTGPSEGVLFAHIDDSFIRAYTINAASIKQLIP